MGWRSLDWQIFHVWSLLYKSLILLKHFLRVAGCQESREFSNLFLGSWIDMEKDGKTISYEKWIRKQGLNTDLMKITSSNSFHNNSGNQSLHVKYLTLLSTLFCIVTISIWADQMKKYLVLTLNPTMLIGL